MKRWLPLLSALLCLAGPGAWGAEPADDPIRKIVDSEELILKLTKKLASLNASAGNLHVPDHQSRALFASRVVANDLGRDARPRRERTLGRIAAAYAWPVSGAERSVPIEDLDLWRPLLEEIDHFEHAKFAFVEGDYSKSSPDEWRVEIAFTALARTAAGGWRSIAASIDTHWTRSGGPDNPPGRRSWRIDRWQLEELSTVDSDRRFFTDRLDTALRDESVLRRARGSTHERYLLDLVRQGDDFRPPHTYFRVKPTDFQPGLSVVDIDRDGFDDLYVMDRWGKNLLLRNRGDGSFEEIAGRLGLDIEDHGSAAIFADFDNDGDADVFLGRTLERSLYLVNEDGRYVDRSAEHVSGLLPALVTSVSAADVNGDGLLDVYFSTYAAELLQHQLSDLQASGRDEELLLAEFLPADQARRITRGFPKSHWFLERMGPPNVLLLNRGNGRFAPSPELALWRNTFQSTWGDYDGDGDADVYVANDFAPNNLYRNEGDGTFVDVTEQTNTSDIGFGMGASWGDYDNDGRHDLYVSNMYSKAGRRITTETPGLDPRLEQMSRGNSLFRNQAPGFEKASGLAPPSLQVEKAGWSWGGQFVDVDNDGYLDLYAASGFYSAPHQVAIEGADL